LEGERGGGALLIGVEVVLRGKKGTTMALGEMGRGPRPDRQAVNDGPATTLVGGWLAALRGRCEIGEKTDTDRWAPGLQCQAAVKFASNSKFKRIEIKFKSFQTLTGPKRTFLSLNFLK
jgi:hypothetical protein